MAAGANHLDFGGPENSSSKRLPAKSADLLHTITDFGVGDVVRVNLFLQVRRIPGRGKASSRSKNFLFLDSAKRVFVMIGPLVNRGIR